MKIGTAPKITVGAVGIVALVFIGFIGSRQLLSLKDNRSPSVEVVAPTSNTTAQSVAQTHTTSRDDPTTPMPKEQWQISTKEIEQLQNFFSQFDESDAQSETDTQQFTTESESEIEPASPDTSDTNASSFTTTEQSAEDVMNTYLEAFRNFDVNAMLTL